MARPSRNTDKLLITAGRKLLPKTGISGLSLRRVAAEAKVNLGMFHYHFHGKRDFVRRVLQEVYEEFFKGFSLESAKGGPAAERLEACLVALAHFARRNRELILMMVRDAMDGEPEALRFARENFPRHIGIVARLVVECQKEGSLREGLVPMQVFFLAMNSVLPNIGATLVERSGTKTALGMPLPRFRDMLLSDESIELRVKTALRGVRRTP
ncbi:MAG: TetR family transcriptional regulator [Elusimicrobiota bacterium]